MRMVACYEFCNPPTILGSGSMKEKFLSARSDKQRLTERMCGATPPPPAIDTTTIDTRYINAKYIALLFIDPSAWS